MRDDFLVFGSPLIGEAEIAEVVDSLRSSWIGTGPKVQRFEAILSEYVGAGHCRCVSSCTAAVNPVAAGGAGSAARTRCSSQR